MQALNYSLYITQDLTSVTLHKKLFVNMSKRRAYSVEFKTEVIKFAENHSNRETGRKFKIDESMVRRWLQK